MSRHAAKILLLIGIGTSAISLALADVIDVTVNGTASGAGGYAAPCFFPAGSPPPPYCSQPGGPGSGPFVSFGDYTFSETNTGLVAFSGSGSVTADQPYVVGASVSSYANQDVTTTADSLNINLTGGYSASKFLGFHSNEQDIISVGFDLTQASTALFQGGIYPGFAPNLGELLDSHGNVILTILPSINGTSTTLQPGQYYLSSSISGSDSGSFGGSASGTDFDLSLNASFSPVPEPRGEFAGAVAAALIAGSVISLRRRRKGCARIKQEAR